MWKWGTTTGLRALSVLYLLGVSGFGVAAALQSHQPWVVAAREGVKATGPVAVSTTHTLILAARTANEEGIKPAFAWIGRTSVRFFHQADAWLSAKPVVTAPARVAAAKPAAKLVLVRPPAAKVKASPVVPATPNPAMQLAQPDTETQPLMPAPDSTPPAPGEVARVLSHLKISLTKELYENFSLFLFVSKADHGPWHQRMFVFAKEDSGDLKLKYSFPVSTGREMLTPGPTGKLLKTNTPQGYFQIDPDRIYRRYRSGEWDHPMPYAMFFSWEHDGLQTGVAIHSAVGEDVKLLGARASAGCVRLAPQNAELLFDTIKKNYRGLTPRFAYDRRTATMSNDGLLMHDKAGNLEYADGYKVLVLIENNGGDDMIAALF